ncbi:MAG TPA: OmcA/MtrC family decaheme c-type cytochrome, partial [Steroidobacteraceae bacterium]|nr:OmcA/MtrC family decaheme c-type cytochrome [Steroidobacteraceae bacterium]
DFRVMIHKIHSGGVLPSVAAGGVYGIYGANNTFVNFTSIVFPQDTRNCQACHNVNDPNTPQASNYTTVISRQACTSCHDNLNFTTGANHGSGVVATDDECASCHGPNSTLNNGYLRPELAHLVPEEQAAQKFKFEVVKVEAVKVDGTPGATACAAGTVGCKVLPGEYAKVTIRVSNPATGTLYKITDAPFTNTVPCTPVPPATSCTPTAARLRVRVAYTTQNFVNRASGNYPAQPILIDFLSAAAAPSGAPIASGGLPTLNADGTYTKVAAVPIAAGLVGGTGEAFLEGRVVVDVSRYGSVANLQAVGPDSSAGVLYPITDSTPVARRAIVDVAKCDACHHRLTAHGSNRTNNTELCAACHNPENANGTTVATGQPFDFKFLIHGIHNASYNFGGLSFQNVLFPGNIANCTGCHVAGGFYPVNPFLVFATSFTQGLDPTAPTDDIARSPNAAACSACHNGSYASAHMQLYGAAFAATKNPDGSSVASTQEQCGLCHGAGGYMDVAVLHGISGN